MKTTKYFYTKFNLIFGLILLTTISCNRDLSEDIVVATYPTTADIFLDDPVGLTDEFFISFDPAAGANTKGFGTDKNEFYEGTSSIRIDVPAPNDPDGGFIGGIFKDRGDGRDLSGYDALTFWAKGNTTASMEVGFGTDFLEDKYPVGTNINLTTGWKKYIIPIPDPSKLTQEKGMFLFSAGTNSTNGFGYTIWMDELKFEKLGTIGQPRPSMNNGNVSDFISVKGQTLAISAFSSIYNLGNGQDVVVNVSPNYFNFVTSDVGVATVDRTGKIFVNGVGEASVTATLAGENVKGSINVKSFEEPQIISIFSDIYANISVDNYNGFYQPFQTTLGGFVNEAGNGIIDYTVLNFVAIEFYGRDNSGNEPIDVTNMTNFNISIRVNETVNQGDYIEIELINSFGNNQTSGMYKVNSSNLVAGQWVNLQIPLSSFSGLNAKDAIGAVLFVSDATISNVSLDEIYFSK